jgi:hypothetical protein
VLPWRLHTGTQFSGKHDEGFRLQSGSVESRELFTDYMLQMQYRQGMNSGQAGLFIRSLLGRERPGYEVSLQNVPQRRDRESAVGVDAGGIRGYDEHARCIRALDQEWTYLTVVAMGRQLQTWVNGVPVSYIHEERTIQKPKGPFLEPGMIRLSVPKENISFQFRHLLVTAVPP